MKNYQIDKNSIEKAKEALKLGGYRSTKNALDYLEQDILHLKKKKLTCRQAYDILLKSLKMPLGYHSFRIRFYSLTADTPLHKKKKTCENKLSEAGDRSKVSQTYMDRSGNIAEKATVNSEAEPTSKDHTKLKSSTEPKSHIGIDLKNRLSEKEAHKPNEPNDYYMEIFKDIPPSGTPFTDEDKKKYGVCPLGVPKMYPPRELIYCCEPNDPRSGEFYNVYELEPKNTNRITLETYGELDRLYGFILGQPMYLINKKIAFQLYLVYAMIAQGYSMSDKEVKGIIKRAKDEFDKIILSFPQEKRSKILAKLPSKGEIRKIISERRNERIDRAAKFREIPSEPPLY